MSREFMFEEICSDESSILDVIFVHGLTGDAKATWSTENKEFWPPWLREELKHISIYTLGYPASLFELWAKKEMDIFERAGNVLEHLAGKGIGKKPLVFVGHSLGGILIKILIRKSDEAQDQGHKSVSESTKLVIFLATPHKGSGLANILKVLPGTSSHIKLLANETGFLEDLNSHYRSYANNDSGLATVVYYEKYTTKSLLVVSRESADPGVAGAQPTALDKDHISICKPLNREDIVYLGIKRHVKNAQDNVIDNHPRSKTEKLGFDYSVPAENDRRNLLDKLIDANRGDEYDFANNAQNEFARSYIKTGLFSNSREDHEELLSEVQTRFITHIYHPLICKGAQDDEISDALQKYILDPLPDKNIGTRQFSSRSILCALYYLTEQCHIKWDYQP